MLLACLVSGPLLYILITALTWLLTKNQTNKKHTQNKRTFEMLVYVVKSSGCWSFYIFANKYMYNYCIYIEYVSMCMHVLEYISFIVYVLGVLDEPSSTTSLPENNIRAFATAPAAAMIPTSRTYCCY